MKWVWQPKCIVIIGQGCKAPFPNPSLSWLAPPLAWRVWIAREENTRLKLFEFELAVGLICYRRIPNSFIHFLPFDRWLVRNMNLEVGIWRGRLGWDLRRLELKPGNWKLFGKLINETAVICSRVNVTPNVTHEHDGWNQNSYIYPQIPGLPVEIRSGEP